MGELRLGEEAVMYLGKSKAVGSLRDVRRRRDDAAFTGVSE
jgi:hypothetical protein